MYVSGYVCMNTVFMEARRGLGDGVTTSSREVPLWYWELNLGPLEDPMPLTAESSLQPFILMLAVFPSFEISTES